MAPPPAKIEGSAKRQKITVRTPEPKAPGAPPSTAPATSAKLTAAALKSPPWATKKQPDSETPTQKDKFKDVKVPGARPKFNLFNGSPQGNNEACKTVKLALVDLFAGLRTSHVAAAEVKNLEIVLTHSAEQCSFANKLAAKNKIKETLHTDVMSLTEAWAQAFVEEAIRLEAQAIVATAGFPCKDLSRQRGKGRKNLEGQFSKLFYEIPRIKELLVKVANGRIPVFQTS